MAEELIDQWATLVSDFPQIHVFTDHNLLNKAGGNLLFPAGPFHADKAFSGSDPAYRQLHLTGLIGVTDGDGVVHPEITQGWVAGLVNGVWQILVTDNKPGDDPITPPPAPASGNLIIGLDDRTFGLAERLVNWLTRP